MKKFKPMLCPNATIDIKTLKYPLLVSYKLDGIRCIFRNGEMTSRALKQFPNVQLRKRFEGLAKVANLNNILLDGELLSKSLTFNELSGLTRQLDKELPDDLFFYCFDIVKNESFNQPFKERLNYLTSDYGKDIDYVKIVMQNLIFTVETVNKYYEEALDWGCDGLILRDPNGKYKFGRGTIKEGSYASCSASLTSAMNRSINSIFFLPGEDSIPEDTSTPYGFISFITFFY
jgi:DNA ligase-1